MIKTVLLDPNILSTGYVNGQRTTGELAAEPSLFSCSMEHAEAKGGDITQEILHQIKLLHKKDMALAFAAGLHEVIDVRVQRLMPGMYPSIPGWHCDSVPRANYFAQPDFSLVNPASFHITCIVDTSRGPEDYVSNTEFCHKKINFNYDDAFPVWKQLHDQLVREGVRGPTYSQGQLLKFSSLTPHRAQATATRGWRMFFRMSMYVNPPVVNGVPSQQQVYVLSEANGW